MIIAMKKSSQLSGILRVVIYSWKVQCVFHFWLLDESKRNGFELIKPPVPMPIRWRECISRGWKPEAREGATLITIIFTKVDGT